MLPRLIEAGVFGSAQPLSCPMLPAVLPRQRCGNSLAKGLSLRGPSSKHHCGTIRLVTAGAVTCDPGAWQGDTGSSVSSEWARVPAGPAGTSQSDLQQPQFPHLPTQDLDTIHLLDPCQLAHPDCDSDLALGFP